VLVFLRLPYCLLIIRFLSISVQRLRILQQKKEAQAKASRRDIASLLERSRIETARVKVENSPSVTLVQETPLI
jgi:hypothetical protein